MLMPIVSMNKMAMNESVATSCCFREVVDVTNVVWKTLYGGYIGTAYVDTLATKDNVGKSGLFALEYLDYDLIPTVTEPAENFVWNTTEGKWWLGNVMSLDAWIATGNATKKSCKHDSPLCTYKEYKVTIKNNQHIGSTAKHDTKTTGWDKPHDAKQWAS